MEAEREAARLAALYATAVLDTPPEADFDDIAALASDICGTAIGMVSLVDGDRQWAKAGVGWDGSPQTPRELSFCARAIEHPGIFEIGDTVADPQFAGNPLVTGEGVRFYAGAPLVLQDRVGGTDGPGLPIGTVCVLDREPRRLSEQQRRALQSLARHAAAHLELRRYARDVTTTADRLRELERMKDSFLASVGHELRTPLSSIRGYLELLLDGDDMSPDTSRQFLCVMQRNADRLLRLVEDLLLVSSLQQQDGLALDLRTVDLAAVARATSAESRPLAAFQQIEIVERLETPAPVCADAHRLGQALSRMLFNALKFTPAGGTITVGVTADPVPTLTVTDTGVGIPAADLPFVFDRFHRSTTADELSTQGAGVGLTIVKAIVDAHGGTIAMASSTGPDSGTVISVTLDAAAEDCP
ncbi:GAF domain-containing sensor histidine kinase [Dactylosporangium sp. CS-047395]|uniref:GAF domain-containing sensor histidine kinase n=1 Tax=Dactylosporangium sp. CS-047395 TaxID=3239936 RepID=UPI003D8F0307